MYTTDLDRFHMPRISCHCHLLLLLRRLSRVMLLLEPALGTTEVTYQSWREPDFYMGFESHHGSPSPAETVKFPQTGSQGGFSIAGMDLFASLDMDALLGSAATAATLPQGRVASGPSDVLTGHGQRSFHASYPLMHSISAATPHQPHPQAPHISAIMPQPLPAQMQQAPAAQTLLAHPQVAPINLLIAQTPAISIARAGQSCSAPAGQLSLGQVPGWKSISAPVGACENKPFSAQVRCMMKRRCTSLSACALIRTASTNAPIGGCTPKERTELPCMSKGSSSHATASSSSSKLLGPLCEEPAG